MNEKDLNIEYICKKTLLNKGDELVPIILDLIQESYKAGLCQAEFDNTMNLIEETQELKKKYVNAVADYVHKDTLTATDYVELNKDNELLMSYNQALLKKNQELKKQLNNCYCNRTDCVGRIKDSKVYDSLEQKVETQQKEFIKYLESWKENEKYCYLASSPIDRCRKDIYEEILKKYKEIIGGSDEKK